VRHKRYGPIRNFVEDQFRLGRGWAKPAQALDKLACKREGPRGNIGLDRVKRPSNSKPPPRNAVDQAQQFDQR